MFRPLVLGALVFVAGVSLADEQVAVKTLKLPFKIADVGWMNLRVSTAGALPAEDRPLYCEGAGKAAARALSSRGILAGCERVLPGADQEDR